MQKKLMGSLFITAFLLLECGQAFSQSISPSKLDPLSPIGTPFFHILSCYDLGTGALLNCRVLDELVGIDPPPGEPANNGGHTHGGTFPLIDLSGALMVLGAYPVQILIKTRSSFRRSPKGRLSRFFIPSRNLLGVSLCGVLLTHPLAGFVLHLATFDLWKRLELMD